MNEREAQIVLEARSLCGGSDAGARRAGIRLEEAIRNGSEQDLVHVAKDILEPQIVDSNNLAISDKVGRSTLWLVAGCTIAFAVGVFSYQVGGSRVISILAPPILVLVVWNLLAYLRYSLLAVFSSRKPAVDHLPDFVRGWIKKRMRGSAGGGRGSPFHEEWLRIAGPLYLSRFRAIMHSYALFLALGAVVGLYLRGLAVEYRAGWESTFLGADAVHSIVGTVLLPASLVSGIALPSPDEVKALDLTINPRGGDAAVWIHLYAITAAIFIVVPRAVLAGLAGWRSRSLSRNLLSVSDLQTSAPPEKKLHGSIDLFVIPYCHRLDDERLEGFSRELERATGMRTTHVIAESIGYGEEGEAAKRMDSREGGQPALLANLATTPEAETVGVLLESMAAGLGDGESITVLLDAAEFGSGISHDSGLLESRIGQRMDAWQAILGRYPCKTIMLRR